MIACALHDYIEAAVVLRLLVRVEMKTGEVFEGIASDVLVNGARKEYLAVKSGDSVVDCVLTEIHKITALTENPNFREIIF